MLADNTLERYRPLVEDYSALLDACRTPLPLVIWRNPLRSTRESISDWIDTERNGLEPCLWLDDAFRVGNPDSVEYVAAYLAGLFHIQEEIALLPVLVLDPRPGERILDLCAAPGNKTAQIAASMSATGTVIANDLSTTRAGVIRIAMNRLGLTNVVLTASNASDFPTEFGLYDRVLADVPCSCEGTSRKYPSILRRFSLEKSEQLSRLQLRILKRAIKLCKPGGRIVYATCTYAPEENECVVADVLRNPVDGGRVRVIKPRIPGLHFSTGITRWRGEKLPSELENSLRIWPHQNDTGGFYVAVLEKEESFSGSSVATVTSSSGFGAGMEAGADTRPAARSEARTDTRNEAGAEVRPDSILPAADVERFGFNMEDLYPYRQEVFSRKYTSLVGRDVQIPSSPLVLTAGVRAINTKGSESRLSTAGAMLLGNSATKSIVDLNLSELKYFLSREDIRSTGAWSNNAGSVIIRSKNVVFGLGSVSRSSGNSVLKSFFPRSWAGVEVASRLAATGEYSD